MMMAGSTEEPAAEFASSLRDLTTNSKPLISMLTMLADESREHAAKIVEAIENYLRTSEPSIKLPSLYLIDSIVKNIGDPYVQLFTENIVRNFVLVFQEGDERIRTALFKLRQTWKEIFPERKLYALDLNTQAVDPNWPVCAAAPIHVNPKFFKKPPSELEIARGTESELKCLDERQKQLDCIQEELRRKRDEIAQKTGTARIQRQQQLQQQQQLQEQQQQQQQDTPSLNGQLSSPHEQQQHLSRPPPQHQKHQSLSQQKLSQQQPAQPPGHGAQIRESAKPSAAPACGRSQQRIKKEPTNRQTAVDKATENSTVDPKNVESKKPKRYRERDKLKKEAAEKVHINNNNDNDIISTSNITENEKEQRLTSNHRRKENEPFKPLASKFRIPKKNVSNSATTGSITASEELAKASIDVEAGSSNISSGLRKLPLKRSSPVPTVQSFHSSKGQQVVAVDKEPLNTATGDVDLRLLEPRPKRRKEDDYVLGAFPSSKEDTDLRIRPKGGVAFPGQASLTSVSANSPRGESNSMDVEITESQTAHASSRECSSESPTGKRDPRAKKRVVSSVRGAAVPGEKAGEQRVQGAPGLDNALLQEGVAEPDPVAPPKPPSTGSSGDSSSSSTLAAEQLVRDAERLFRGPSVDASRGSSVVAGDVHAPPSFAPPQKRKPERVNMRLLNSLQLSNPAPEFGQILLDRQMRDIRFVDGVAVAIMEEAAPGFVHARVVCFRSGPRPIVINDHQCVMTSFDGEEHPFSVNGNTHRIRFGAPLRELFIDGVAYSCQFDGCPIKVRSGEDVFTVALPPPCPTVCDKRPAPAELLAKLGLRPIVPSAVASLPSRLGPSSSALLGVPQGPLPVATGAAGGSSAGPVDSGVVTNSSGRGPTGGWVRYQEEHQQRPPPAQPSHPQIRPMPSLFPPPMPPNIGCSVMPGPSPGFVGPPCGPPPSLSVPPPFHQPHSTFRRPPMLPGQLSGPLDGLGRGAPLGPPPCVPGSFAPSQRSGPGLHLQHPSAPAGSAPPPPSGVGIPVTAGAIASSSSSTSSTSTSIIPTSQLDVSDLLNRLVEQGLISNSSASGSVAPAGTAAVSTTSNDANAGSNVTTGGGTKNASTDQKTQKKDQSPSKDQIPAISFEQPALLKRRYAGVISALHEGIQCSACGQRFQQGDKSTSDKYAQHLDWHFRLKRRDREGLRKATSRKWFFGLSDWLDFEEVEDLDERARNYFEEQEVQQDSNSQEAPGSFQTSAQEVPSVEVARLSDGVSYSCELCHESFEKYFCEDSEAWQLRNAVLFDGKIFHPVCHEDYLKPAPVHTPHATLRSVADEISSSARSSTVPPEPDSKPDNVSTANDESALSAPVRTILDESSQPLPGLDFDPSTEAVVDAQQLDSTECDQQQLDAKVDSLNQSDASPEDANEPSCRKEHDDDDVLEPERNDESPVVVVEKLGEFGVDSGIVQSPKQEGRCEETAEEKTAESKTLADGTGDSSAGLSKDDSKEGVGGERSREEIKVVVKGSGGFVLKVKQDSVAAVNLTDQTQSAKGGATATGDLALGENVDDASDEEWRPPTPDPRFKNLPPLKKGSEMSGLCSIM